MPSTSKGTSGANKNKKISPDTPVSKNSYGESLNTQPDAEPMIKEINAKGYEEKPADTGKTVVNIASKEEREPQEVFVEHFDLSSAYISVTISAKISPKQYESREAGISMKLPLDPEAGSSARKSMAKAMFAECRKLISEQLGEISKM